MKSEGDGGHIDDYFLFLKDRKGALKIKKSCHRGI